MSHTVVLIGGYAAGMVVSFDHRHPYVTVAEKPTLDITKFAEPPEINYQPLKTHDYRIFPLIPGVYVGRPRGPNDGHIDSIVTELLEAYVQHHHKPPPPDHKGFVEGFSLARELLAAVNEKRIRSVSDN